MKSALLAAAVFLLAGFACVPRNRHASVDPVRAAADRAALADAVVANWQPQSRLAARKIIEQYGVPDEVRPERLTWTGRGPWASVVVHEMTPPYVQADELGVLEQSVPYPMTPEQIVAIADFDRHLRFDGASGQLVSRADREEVNFLRLNLAHEIAEKRLTPRQAVEMQKHSLELEAAGKTTHYLLGLRFGPAPARRTTP